jgi:cytochrome oxidase Cu insertion factor (SCO1/SenC/PrrC family)
MSPAARRGLIVFVAALIIILGGFAVEQWRLSDDNAPGGIAVGGPFSLIDQNGTPRRDSDFRGKLMLVYFGYTYCPDACPTTLLEITQAMDILGASGDGVQPIFISVDPQRDTVAQLKLYASNFTPRLLALTGAPNELLAVEQAYHVYVAKVPQSGNDDYLIDHTSIMYLMGRDGKYLAQFPTGLPPKTLAAGIQRFM